MSTIQKKNGLNSTIIDNKLSSTDQFDQMIEKQLNDDFKVSEDLNENHVDEHENTEKFMALLNKLLVQKREKIKVKEHLLNSRNICKSPIKGPKSDSFFNQTFLTSSVKKEDCDTICDNQVINNDGDCYYTEEEYLRIKEESEIQQQNIEQQTEQQLQVRKILWKEINQKKKSLNLLKGDIGHMISRNQSISVLESKVSKVKLVSEHQQKRVCLAFGKDKQQIQLRQQMQKKFHSKLNTFRSSESRNLVRTKLHYIQTMKRRKQIYEKLNQIQSQSASIQLYSDKQKQSQQKNAKTLSKVSLLSLLCTIIQSVPHIWNLFINKQIDHLKYCQKIKQQFNSIMVPATGTKRMRRSSSWQIKTIFNNLDELTPQNISQFIKQILNQYYCVQREIQEKKKVYNQLIRSVEQLNIKSNWLIEQELKVVHGFSEQQGNIVMKSWIPLDQYRIILQQLQNNNKFMSKRISGFSGSIYISKLYENFIRHHKMINCYHQNNQCYSSTDKKQESKSLNNKLSTLKQQQSFPNCLFDEIISDIRIGFQEIAHKLQARKSEENPSLKCKNGEKNIQNFISDVINQWQNPSVEKYEVNDHHNNQYNAELQIENNYSELNNKNQINNIDPNNPKDSISLMRNHAGKMINPLKSCPKISHNADLAKRVQLLENIDQRYYKMIKDTLQMQKQNTRKNYDFQKNFKRTKYSTQDELLEEKRFQSAFSGLFKQDSDHSTMTRRTEGSNFSGDKILHKSASKGRFIQDKTIQSNTFHTRASHKFKKGKENSLMKISNRKLQSSYSAKNKGETDSKLPRYSGKCQSLIAQKKQMNIKFIPVQNKSTEVSAFNRKNLHLKLQEVISLV